jgi:hypothetical protein
MLDSTKYLPPGTDGVSILPVLGLFGERGLAEIGGVERRNKKTRLPTHTPEQRIKGNNRTLCVVAL